MLLCVYCGLYSVNAAAFVDDESTKNSTYQSGKSVFDTQCAACHLGAVPEAPTTEALKLFNPERIVTALTTGAMSTQGIPLTKQQKQEVAYYLTGKAMRETGQHPMFSEFACKTTTPMKTAKVLWNGWGGDIGNQRHQSSETILSPENIKTLSLKWAFGFPDTTRVRSQPVVTQDSLFIGSQEGIIFALDRKIGCIQWTFQAQAEVRGGIHIQTDKKGVAKNLLFGDFKANAYSLDARTGKLHWKVNVDSHPVATITGSVSAWGNTVFVPVSSLEVISAARDDYQCCSFRGALVALDIKTGKLKWRSFTTEKPKATSANDKGIMQYGPSGAPIWSRPTADPKRGVVYVTTGQNYSSPATLTSDAVLAFDMQNGAMVWSTQVWKNDAWNGACVRRRLNCPKEDGPDFDMGTGALLTTTSTGKDILLAGQKSGLAFAFDPEQNGKLLWQKRVGKGGTMGGVHWGLSSDGDNVFIGVSDLETNNPYAKGKPMPGVTSLSVLTGQENWQQILPDECPKDLKFRCYQGVSAAVSSSPDLVFAGGLDGVFRIYHAKTGEILWRDNTRRPYSTINNVKANGGAIEADGPVIADGEVFITSGYDKWGEIPGNVLLVYSLGGE